MGKGAWIVGCSFCGAVVITSIVLIACSFGVLNNNELGLDYDNIGEKINTNTLFTNGRHFLGLGHVFVKYPALQQTVSYSTASTATEGPIDVRGPCTVLVCCRGGRALGAPPLPPPLAPSRHCYMTYLHLMRPRARVPLRPRPPRRLLV